MTDTQTASTLIQQWLQNQCSPDSSAWLNQQIEKIPKGPERAFFLAFSMAPRKMGKKDLTLSEQDQKEAQQVRKDWMPNGWTVDQAARAVLVLSLPQNDPEKFIATLDKVFAAADVGELVALYQMLPVLPFPDHHKKRAAEGIRTNIRTVFSAVAHRNPYPKEQLDQGAWNQMVLKALFVGVTLDPIQGIDERANEPLMTMLVDYAHERWSAHRDVSPELWRCVGPFADNRALDDLEKVMASGTPLEQQGATLALLSCPDPRAREILTEAHDLQQQAEQGTFTWESIAREFEEKST